MKIENYEGFVYKIGMKLALILKLLSDAKINHLNINPESIMLDFRGNRHFELCILKDYSYLSSDSDFEIVISLINDNNNGRFEEFKAPEIKTN